MPEKKALSWDLDTNEYLGDLKTSDTARDCVQSQATKFKADFNLLFVDEDNRISINISVFKHSLPRAVNSRSIFMDHF